MVAQQVGLLGLEVGRTVLEAQQVARASAWAVRRRRRTAVAQLRPAHADHAEADPGQVAHRVHGHLRVVARRPGRRGRRRRSPAAARRRGSGAGPPGRPAAGRRARTGRCPCASRNRLGAEADGQRELGRRQADRLAGVLRRRLGDAADRADRRRRRGPAVIRARRRGPVLQHLDELRRGRR